LLLEAVAVAALVEGSLKAGEAFITTILILVLCGALVIVGRWRDFEEASVICSFNRSANSITVQKKIQGKDLSKHSWPFDDLEAVDVQTLPHEDADDYALRLRIRGRGWVRLSKTEQRANQDEVATAIRRFAQK
jgi:hypothetical protein